MKENGFTPHGYKWQPGDKAWNLPGTEMHPEGHLISNKFPSMLQWDSGLGGRMWAKGP
jgi:hypothetical protein